MSSPTVHSKLGASSMHRWAACPGSVQLGQGMPNTSSKYAQEGTLAHEYAAESLEFFLNGKVFNSEGLKDVTEEMINFVTVYLDAFCEEAHKSETELYQVYIEKKFSLEKIYPGLFGTNDGMIYNDDTSTLSVWDLKYGAGIPVEVEENEQLMYYALGALLELGIKCDWIEMVICQPRCEHKDGPIRRWKIPTIQLIDFAADLVEAAKRTQLPTPELVPGDHCRFCPAVSKCTALSTRATEAAKLEFSPNFSYDENQLAKTLSILPSIEAWIEGVKEFAFNEAQQGRIPPGCKLVNKQGRRKWIDEETVEHTLLLELGLDYTQVREKPDLKSPAQIEKLLSKEDKKFIDTLTVKESSGVKLVPETDRSPSITETVKTEFTVITND